MRNLLQLLIIGSLLIGPSQLLAGSVGRSSTGTSTETSTSTSSTSSSGTCAGDSTAGKSSDPSGATVISGCTVTPPAVDDDGDGMISSWEMANDLDEYDVADKLLDLDNDHISNLVEYLRKLKANDADYDDDNVLDGDDINPSSAEFGLLSIDALYNGSVITEDSRPK